MAIAIARSIPGPKRACTRLCIHLVVGMLVFVGCTTVTGDPVKLLIDTDAGFDVDDIGAIAVANALQDLGECEIVAIGHTNGFDKGIGAVSAVMRFYNRDSVSLGAYKGPWARDPNAGKGTADKYVSDLETNYPAAVNNSEFVDTAVEVYRRVLSQQPDHSVHIASIGITTNMRDLILSRGDQHSPLSGAALVAKKVSLIVWMDMMYNFGCAQHDTDDWLGPDTDCRGSAQAAVMGWPSSVKQIFSPVGGDVKHGSWLTGCAARDNPVRQAFEDYLGPNNGRWSWDPIAVMIAVRGAQAIHCKEIVGGHNTVAFPGQETWVDGPFQNQSRIEYSGASSQSSISFALNELLCKPAGENYGNWSANWNAAVGENCYDDHGATDLEKPPSSSCGDMSITDCQQKCKELSECTAITVQKTSSGKYACYRKADVSLAHCDVGTNFDTYVRSQWLFAGGFNCYPGHGAIDLETPRGSSSGVMDVRSCQSECAKTPGCSAIGFAGVSHSGKGSCYRKANVSLSKCDVKTVFDMYLARTAF